MVSFDGIPVYLPSIFRARPCKTHRPVLANKSSSCMMKFPIVSDLVQKPGTQAEAGAIDSHPSANPSANAQKMDNAYSNHGQSFCEQHSHQHSSTIKCSKNSDGERPSRTNIRPGTHCRVLHIGVSVPAKALANRCKSLSLALRIL